MKSLVYFFLCVWSALALAHKPSDSYLSINIQNNHLSGRWDIALRDLDFAIGLDDNDDGAITWGELRSKSQAINRYVFPRLHLSVSNKACSPQQTDLKVDEHTDGKYAVLFFDSTCGVTTLQALTVDYRLFADLDPQHRGLLNLTHDTTSFAAALVPGKPARVFGISATRTPWTEAQDFIREGVWHIWIGFDHILFLFSLLIPSVMAYESARWRPVANFRLAFWDVAKVVTAFTLAHSITLSVAVLGFVELPSRWVESAIAASVILAALNNITPIFTDKRTLLAFTFGLIHGFGFASALRQIGIPEGEAPMALFTFNVGVEIGQLMIVAAALIALALIRRFAQTMLRPTQIAAAYAIGALASAWFLERTFL